MSKNPRPTQVVGLPTNSYSGYPDAGSSRAVLGFMPSGSFHKYGSSRQDDFNHPYLLTRQGKLEREDDVHRPVRP